MTGLAGNDDIHGEHISDVLPAYVNGSLDRPSAERAREHLAHCSACQIELAAWVKISSATQTATRLIPVPSADLMDRVWAEIDRTEAPRSLDRDDQEKLTGHPSQTRSQTRWSERMITMIQAGGRRLFRPLTAVAAAAVVAGALVLTPVGSYAQNFLTIFQPKQFVAIPVTTDEVKSLPNLRNYGTVTMPTHQSSIEASTAAEASSASGMTILTPASLPSGVPTTVTYVVKPGESGSFTFSAAKAKAAAAAKGETLPPMPANIDGSTLNVSTGAVVLAVYGNNVQSKNAIATASSNDTQADGRKSAEGSTTSMSNLPSLVIAQTAVPTVQSTGASAQELENYLLAQPGISPQLVSAIKAIGDPSSTMPIPIPVNKGISHPIQVQGVQGLSVADSTGIGGGIVWQKGGVIYAIGGTLPESQLIAIANSLH